MIEKTTKQKNDLLNADLHRRNKEFGHSNDGSGVARHLPLAIARLHELGICNSIIDYGTGKGALIRRLQSIITEEIDIVGYDPAIKEYSTKPTDKADLLLCLDVLEHIEKEDVDDTLQNIKSLTKYFCFLVIDLQPAVKNLADGRNAHVLIAPSKWWISKISGLFPCLTCLPIMHKNGEAQKVVILASNDSRYVPAMNMFLVKLKICNLVINGGVLGEIKMKGNI